LLEIIKIAIVAIKQRLVFTLASPEELIQMIIDDERFKMCEMLMKANILSGKFGFEKGWKEAVKSQKLLSSYEIDVIKSVADIIGKSDLETQTKQLEIVIDQLAEIIAEHKNRIGDCKKLYLTLGFLSSAAFAVMLI